MQIDSIARTRFSYVRAWNAFYPRHRITDLKKKVKILFGGWSEEYVPSRIQVGCGAMSLVSGF
jgi:hypothetical protein